MIFDFIRSGLDAIKDANKETVKQMVLAESLSCNKCEGLAVPVYDSDNKYKCTKCGRQFSGSNHKISQKIRRHFGKDMGISYGKAVNEIGS